MTRTCRALGRVHSSVLIVIAVLLLGGIGWWVFAQRDPARTTRPFRVGFEASPPLQLITPDGRPTGPAIEIFAAAAAAIIC